MSKLLRFIGRLLIVSLLISAAVIKLKAPHQMKKSFETGYSTLTNQHPLLRNNLPRIIQIDQYIPWAIMIIGAFQGLIALMIIFGDRLGANLLIVYLILYSISTYSLAKLSSNQLPQVANLLQLFGIALTLAYPSISSKKPVQKI